MSKNIDDRTRRFRALHEGDDAFVIPNPWDAGSARVLAGLGFEALATTSSGLAFALGKGDGEVSREEHLVHIGDLVSATDLPVSADLENCYSVDPVEAAETIQLASDAGASGGSIEDYSGHPDGRIYDFNHAVERVAAAVETVRSLPRAFVLTARAENLIRGVDDLDDTIKRLQAFEEVGAEVLYAPGLKTAEEVRTVCSAVSRPVNVLATPKLTIAEIAEAGGKRISLGGALARTAIAGFLAASREIAEKGSFTAIGKAPGFPEIVALMSGKK
ncbi:MAG: isocitrate lyase/phosphoenolpyruvate mutase family protein [Hyphomicrobiaceae bacterium]|nr:isocitrate lyase/phosphoenolpyruvate mutase family protein [Hyphomicrobiaceae bacterium]